MKIIKDLKSGLIHGKQIVMELSNVGLKEFITRTLIVN
jgi:hypothetical protein